MSDLTPDNLVERTYDHLNHYISLADNKASILLTAQFAFLGLDANALSNLAVDSQLVRWCSLLSGASGVVSIFLAGWVVYPRMPKPQKGLIFWENIIEYDSADNSQEEVNGLNDGDVRDRLAQENYHLAEVAHGKYSYLRWSLRGTAVMLLLAVVSTGAYLFG